MNDTLKRVIRIIETTDPFLSSDYHICSWANPKHNNNVEIGYRKERDKSRKTYHNSVITNNDTWLCLGDLSEEELSKPEHLEYLKKYVNSLNGGIKILLRGNNDKADTEFYKECGFDYILSWGVKIEIPKMQVILTHEPVPMKEFGFDKDNWINIHGHLHGSGYYYNMDWRRHVDIFPFDNHTPSNAIYRLSKYIDRWKRGMYETGKTVDESLAGKVPFMSFMGSKYVFR